MLKREQVKRLNKKVEKVTGVKFCSNCYNYQSPIGGQTIIIKSGTRWKCANCAKRAIRASQARRTA